MQVRRYDGLVHLVKSLTTPHNGQVIWLSTNPQDTEPTYTEITRRMREHTAFYARMHCRQPAKLYYRGRSKLTEVAPTCLLCLTGAMS